MKASAISKIVILLCILCLITGIYTIDKHRPYNESGKIKSGKNIIANVNKIAVLELEGTIASSYESSFFPAETNASALLKNLSAIQNDNEIKGVIIKLNTPGGTVGMSQNIYNQIMKLKKAKPVISVIDDVAASGGYYIASASDRIIAQDGSLTGSIGVIFSYMDYHNLLANKLNINPVVIKSGKFKDIGSGSRAMTDEEKQLMQDIVNDSYGQFLNAITLGRINRNDNYTAGKTDLTEKTLKTYADGRVFTGKKAKELGFIDVTGDMDTAELMIEKMAQEKFNNVLPVKLVTYGRKSTLSEYFTSLAEYNSKSYITLKDIIPASMILSRKPLYLWE